MKEISRQKRMRYQKQHNTVFQATVNKHANIKMNVRNIVQAGKYVKVEASLKTHFNR